MNDARIEQAFDDLLEWCRTRDFAGHDPFDALNSLVFQSTPLKNFRTPRLIWTQLIKRWPLNLRPLTLVPAQRNAKGVALFALAGLANFRRLNTSEAGKQARDLLDELLRMRIAGFSGAAWGYNFDWQSRNFFAPQGTPMIVPTAFAVRALTEGFETFHDNEYLQVARSAGDFILKDLNRTFDSDEELCFSYSPIDHTQIFNASLFAAETLAGVGQRTRREAEFCELAVRAARYVLRRQRQDGSWAYGAGAAQGWIDSFHTAYVLLSMARILKSCAGGGLDISAALERGYRFWRESFFLADGWPKYYHDELYPADTHAAATAIVTLSELRQLDPTALPLAEKIADWTIRNLRDRQGFFYYQLRRFHTVRTPFMRWTESWMLYALARLLEARAS
jgi:hypothetical protein